MNFKKNILLKRIAPAVATAIAVSALYGHSVYADGNIISSDTVALGDNIVIGAGYYEEDTTIEVPTKEELIARGEDGGITASDIISEGVDLGDAATSNVLSGKTFSSTTAGANATGTMADETGVTQGATSASINDSLLRVTVPVTGYYVNGSSYLTLDVGTAPTSSVLSGATFTSTAGVKTSGTMANYSGTAKTASAASVNSSGVLSLTVPATGYYTTSSTLTYTVGTATQAQVLSGKTFTSSAGVNKAGTMANKAGTTTAASSSIVSSKLRVTIPATGYYDTSSYLTVDVGTATRAQVLSGATFTSTAGVKTTGTMTNNGSVTKTLTPGSSYTLSGYYSGGTITASSMTGTYTLTSAQAGTTVDMGASNTYRYINASALSGGSIIKIGSQMRGGSIDVSSYSGYKNFTVDNFIFKNVNLDMEGGWANLDYMTSSYDTTTGVYTFQLPYHPYTAIDDRHVTGYAKADVYLILN